MMSKPASLSSPPLVWIKQGKTQHAAHLLGGSTDGKARVRWLTSNKIEWLDEDAIIEQKLTPRRRQLSPPSISSSPRSWKRHCTEEATLSQDGGARRISFGEPTTSPFDGKENAASELASDKRAAKESPRQSCNGEDYDDDSSIEVLLTILPPSPKKKAPSKPPSEVMAHQRMDTNDETDTVSSPWSDVNCSNEVAKEGPGLEVNARPSCLSQQAAVETESPGTPKEMEPSRVEAGLEDGQAATVDERKMPALKNPPPQQVVQSPLQDSKQGSTSDPPYSLLTSAYVQNLAEICHTITSDRRWRVGPDQRSLLSWECGDDLSAVLPLACRFRPWPVSKSKSRECHGLLCDCQKKPSGEIQLMDSTDPSVAGCGSKDESSLEGDRVNSQQAPINGNNALSEPPQRGTAVPQGIDTNARSEEDATLDRCLHLYCRLFYRKGPWFRIDDAYSRYYAPKQLGPAPSFRAPPGASKTPDGPKQGTRKPRSQKQVAQAPTTTKEDFFNLKAAAAKIPVTSTNVGSIKGSLIDEKLFQQHMEALELFLRDLIRLREMGLIRSFFNEEECGTTVGTARVLLTADERKKVLTKLGGGRKSGKAQTKQRRPSMIESTSREDSSPPSSSVENEIWNQMCRQKSISSQFTSQTSTGDHTNKGTKTVLLPVTRHVNQVLFDKLATRIVQACSPAEYVAAPAMKARKATIKDIIARALSAFSSNRPQATKNTTSGPQLEAVLGKFGMCIRLREAPLESLQRCARLYLCASGGPGNMRSDNGTNGWKSIRELDRNTVQENTKLRDAHYATNVEPPGNSWHAITYPGLHHRFGLTTGCFQEAYIPLPLCGSDGKGEPCVEQVFFSRSSFLCWEACAELRANADYLIEVNELLLYNERKRVREGGASGKERGETAEDDDGGEQDDDNETIDSSMDFLGLLRPNKRKEIVSAFCTSANGMDVDKICVEMELEVFQVLDPADGRKSPMKTECEAILCVMALVIKRIIKERISTIAEAEVCFAVSKPWLRHLSWEAGLAYILWDIIPILERRGFYLFALQSLELLVEGNTWSSSELGESIIEGSFEQLRHRGGGNDQKLRVAFAHFLLSRRARGKALDRIVIDLTHLLRKTEKAKALKVKGKKGKKLGSAVPQFVASFTRVALAHVVQAATVSFSSIRTLARRLKQPLHKSLESLPSREAQELGIRFGNELGIAAADADTKKYSDWVPITDHAVANSMAIEDSMVGRRCSFVGHEDDQDKAGFTRGLNVEQLAMEFYASGRLPELPVESQEDIHMLKGGWVGWHDEGGLVRALFRVLSFDILGMDWCCQHGRVGEHQGTLHLSPYQGAPFDLHVGFELADPLNANDMETQPNRGFYLRRQDKIKSFLTKLCSLSRQQVSDLVWNSIAARRKYRVESAQKDPSIEKDVLQCRTLSMVAAGFGGQMISAFLRLLFFDYRHYSGGLPDLLLVRAKYVTENTLVDLGEWVGEAFDAKYVSELEAQQRASLLGDRDDDFLGCSKVGDSGGGNSRGRSNIRGRQQPSTMDASVKRVIEIPELPPKLELMHGDSEVEVQCCFVEVKSSNDRLDARQEDWLNVLDAFGNARVCKFSDGKAAKGRKKTKTETNEGAATASTKSDTTATSLEVTALEGQL